MIQKIARDCITHFKNNPFFKKTVILYVITGCIVFFLFGVFTIFGISKASVAHINATEQKMLKQSCNTSNLILRDIHSLANNKFTEDASLLEAMTQPYSVKISQNVQNTFSDIMASSKLIDSMYVINFKNNVIYSTQTSAKSISDFFDINIMEYLEQTPVKSAIFFPRSAELTFNPWETTHIEYITSVYRNSKDYAFVINIDQKQFQTLVNLTTDKSSYETAVIDSNGIVISHSDPERFAGNLSDDPLFKKVINSHQDSGSFKYKGATVNFVRSNTLGYFYTSISTAGNPWGSFSTLLIYMILFTILLLFVYLVCSTFAALSTYSLFNNIKKNIYSLFNKSDSEEDFGNEVKTISKLLNELKSGYSSMEQMQYLYINSKQNSTLKKLLLGTFAYLQDDMKACDITFPYSGFAVVVMRIDNITKMDSDTIYMIKYAIMNMGTEIFEKHSKAYAAEINEYDVEFILNFMTDNFIKESIETLNSYMKKFFDTTVSAAYDSGISDSLEDISVLYHNAKHAIPYKLIKGHSAIIAYSEITQLDNAVSTYPKELEHDIIKSITTQNEDELAQKVNLFVKSLCSTSFNMIILYADRLLLVIDQFSIRSNMSDDTDISTTIHEIVSELETLDDLEKYILSKCRTLMLKFSSTRFDSKKDIMVKNVLEYIENNYTDPNLSIDMIASEINRSANYTRSLFKQSQGISISDYISKKRFDEVCRQLVETNLTAQEIGASIGLNSGSYFYTSFKRHTGYTPDQYRNLHRQTPKK